jgi:hypothetical protein
MTLMLRMDGIPARVGAGFQPTVYDPVSGTWQLRGLDAHAWVEVFLGGIGWVSFDPTPPAGAPALGGGGSELSKAQQVGGAATGGAHPAPARRAAIGRVRRSAASDVANVLWACLAALAALFAAIWLAGRRRLRHAIGGDAAGAAAELARALATLGPAGATVTLARLEGQLERDGHAAAAGYVRGIRELRYRSAAPAPADPSGRSDLRRALAGHRSPRRRLAALLALPPGWVRR